MVPPLSLSVQAVVPHPYQAILLPPVEIKRIPHTVPPFVFSSPLNTTTKELHNPKLDDDGNPMLINISPQAAKNRSDRPNVARALFPSWVGRFFSDGGLEGPPAARYRARRPNVARCSGQAPSRRVPLSRPRERPPDVEGGRGQGDIARRREGTKQRRAPTRPGGTQRGIEHVQATRCP
ncbi:hypothetical protein ACJ73_09054, partial [Blastomyces percursus]